MFGRQGNRWPAAALLFSLALTGCGGSGAGSGSQASSVQLSMVQNMQAQPGPSLLDGLMDGTYQQLDADHNGMLSQQEADLTFAQFRELDTNRNGVIERSEWLEDTDPSQVASHLTPFYPLIDALFNDLDADHDLQVTQDEIQQALAGHGDGVVLSPDTLRAAFEGGDTNHSASLDREEFKKFYLAAFNGDVGSSLGHRHGLAKALLGVYLALAGGISTNAGLYPARRPLSLTPREFNYQYEDVEFKATDGLHLKGWYIPAAKPTTKAVILLHGYFNNRSVTIHRRLPPMLHDEYNLLAFDLRNHGESEGTVTTYGYYEYQDVEGAIAYLHQRGNTDIAVQGVSMGGASVIRAAANDPSIKAVIDDCAFSTVFNAFLGFITKARFPSPRLVAAAAVANANRIVGVDLTSTQPLTEMPLIAPRPLLVIHGADDTLISPDNSRQNYAAAGDGLYKELWIVPKAGHGGAPLAAPDEYKRRMLALLHRVM